MGDESKYRRYAEKIRIFNGLIPEEVEYILHNGKILVFREGQTVFHEGQLGSNLFIVLSGKIGIFKKSKQIATCVVGDAFGEMAVLNHEPRTATAAALGETKLFTLDEKQINGLLEKHIAVRLLLNIIHVLSERLETANEQLANTKL
ncbi:MAG TPA: cyclic nucleotide-binding domain-containing protein [Candidatus Hydrogenedentes bacterium]|nr:cyclic nucleotide-binding domain-containing protein [Candidatus Hydrogenedentota bacterium]